MDYLPAGDFDRLRSKLPKARFVQSEAILARLRQIKTQDEIKLLRRLSRIADQAITDALRAVKAGDTEMDIAAHMTRNIYTLGAEHFKLMIVATGERGAKFQCRADRAQAHAWRCVPRGNILGDLRLSGGCLPHRNRATGPEHGRENLAAYGRVQILGHGHDQARRRAAAPSTRRSFAKLAAMNLPPISFVGHGIGLHLHEDPYIGKTPMIGKTEDAHLEAGMVLGVEPLCYQTATASGCRTRTWCW